MHSPCHLQVNLVDFVGSALSQRSWGKILTVQYGGIPVDPAVFPEHKIKGNERGEKFVILDLPLLYETGAALYLMKEVVVVYCDQATQLKRLMERNNFTQSDAEQRINAQMSLDEKCRRASYVIDNSSNRETTAEQVKRLHDKFTRSYAYLSLRIIGFINCWFDNMAVYFLSKAC
ncbi:hypothetical protein OS493_031602 [Desmophyllum pertusum]|uniref:Dephospho-CoA kinase n=1 Tax=Desmophyllum pertusum TaxID=174260 RepID=A0A9W9YJJ6_9CNID|nr:hypothetical protein OS493_031602 [Desmophyllum pertusum]